MTATGAAPPTLDLVRTQVRDTLSRSKAFRSLDPHKRRELAHDMVNVAHFIVAGERGDSVPQAVILAGEKPPDPAGDTAGSRFKESGAVAAQQGGAAFTDTIQKVDFPKFVAGLIDGVFNAIVDSSIKQMEAYAELVKNVSKSVDQYMKDNVSEDQARDYLADRYPDHLEVDISGEKPRVKPREDADEDNLPDFFADLGLAAPVQSLDEDTVEETLVPAARRRMAMDRQQLLATMVLMGINRLVVTDGKIDASVLFELTTKDSVTRGYTRTSDFQYNRTRTSEGGGEGSGGWSYEGDKWKAGRKSSWYSKGTDQQTANFHVATARTDSSQASVDLHAKLGGKVHLNFKSETFPLDRMADVLQVNQIREKAPATAPVPATGKKA